MLMSLTGPNFKPSSIRGLALWLDASDPATITRDGSDLVSQWRDKSGKGNHVSQATALNKPKYVASAINGRPAIRGRHDGVNPSQLAAPDSASLKYTNFTQFTVARRLSDLNANEYIVAKYDTATNIREFRVNLNGSTTEYFTVVKSSDGTSATGVGPAPATAINTTNAHIFEAAYDGANVYAALDVTATATTASATGVFNGASSYRLFSLNATPQEPFAGYISEHLFFTRTLTAAERAVLYRYFKAKWGIP